MQPASNTENLIRPEIAALRAYLRLRERHPDYSAAHIQHMQKALTFMNLQLHHVVTDITGVTGMKIIRAIVAGERDLTVLAGMRDVRCKATPEILRSALSGNYQPEHLFSLSKVLALYDVYQNQVQQCDLQIETARIKAAVPIPRDDLFQRALGCQDRFGAAAIAVVGYPSFRLLRQVNIHLGIEHPLGQRLLQSPISPPESSAVFGPRPASN